MTSNKASHITALITAVACFCVSPLALSSSNTGDKAKSATKPINTSKHRIHVAPPAPLLSERGERLMQIEKIAVSNPKQAETMAAEFNQTPLEAFARYQWLKSVVNDHSYSAAIASYIQQFSDTSWAN